MNSQDLPKRFDKTDQHTKRKKCVSNAFVTNFKHVCLCLIGLILFVIAISKFTKKNQKYVFTEVVQFMTCQYL
jgi:hypothetical protein